MENITPQQAFEIVTKHIDLHEDNYRKFLGYARSAATAVKAAMGDDVVNRIYSRGDKQSGELKSKSKIIKKLLENSQPGKPFNVEEMADIVGLTVVVYYPDQVAPFIENFQEALNSESIYLEEYVTHDGGRSLVKVHREKGYHATHLKLRTKKPAMVSLRMEVQIKTMLHDAWGAKMHDLVYKPAGELDPKLRALMESFGDSLQAIEVQSETLRDAINGRVHLLQQRRRAALVQLMHRLKSVALDTDDATLEFSAFFEELNGKREELAKCRSDDKLMERTIESISKLKEKDIDPFTRLRLFVFLASLRDDSDLAATVDGAYAEWTKAIPSEEIKSRELTIALVRAATFHQTNRISDAISYLREFIQNHQELEGIAVAKLNLASFLIENSIGALVLDDRHEVQQLLSMPPSFEPGTPEHSSLRSCTAAAKIVFGDDTELEQGLNEYYKAPEEFDPSGAGYRELYLTYGWQRKLRT